MAVTIRCKIFILFCSAVQLPRIATIKDAISEAFLPNVPVETSLQAKKTEEFTGPRTTKKDLEYLTLHKILSFLHAACLMKGELISHADLTRYTFSWMFLFRAFHHAPTSLNYNINKRLYFFRWVREGFIPLYGAHKLLPPTMILSRHDTKILGGVSTGQSNGFPEAKQFRENTAKLLTLLGTTQIPKPPTILVASKILCDLQLPSKHLLFFFS